MSHKDKQPRRASDQDADRARAAQPTHMDELAKGGDGQASPLPPKGKSGPEQTSVASSAGSASGSKGRGGG